jgi:ATP-binding cassette subfamily F protein 3
MELRTNENQLTEQQARAILGAFLFRKDDVHKPIGVLSGGEKSRLALARLLVKPPNLLLMDEPTTHLDIPSIDALTNALKNYEGTLIFISHDVHFIRSLAETVLHVHSGRLTPDAGNYDYYLEKSKASDARAALTAGFSDPRAALKAGFTDGRPTQEANDLKSGISNLKSAAKPAKRSPNEIRKFREHVGQLEKAVVDLETKQADITAALEAPETYADKGKFHHLNRELSTIVDQITAATTAWEDAASKLEEMERP